MEFYTDIPILRGTQYLIEHSTHWREMQQCNKIHKNVTISSIYIRIRDKININHQLHFDPIQHQIGYPKNNKLYKCM